MTRKFKLPNGLTVISDYNKNVETVVVSVGVKVGSRNELPSEEGLSHFLEHMLFKGTTTRTYEEINNTVDFVGASTNAYTSEERTVYYIKTPKDYSEMAFDILSDQVFNSIIPEEELKKEAEVVVQEIKRYLDNPEAQIYDQFIGSVFNGNQLSKPILGEAERILSYTRDDMMAYYKKHYHPKNMVVSVSGNLKYNDLKELANKYFNVENNAPFKFTKPKNANWTGESVVTHVESENQVNVYLGFGFDGRNKLSKTQQYAVTLIHDILSSGMGSKLVSEIREKRGLVYSTNSWGELYDDIGYFVVTGGTDHEKVSEFIEAATLVLRTFNDSLTERDLQKSKNSVIATIQSGYESISNVALSNNAEFLTKGKIVPLKNEIEELKNVTLDDIKDMMNLILSSKPVLSLYGFIPQHEELSKVSLEKLLTVE